MGARLPASRARPGGRSGVKRAATTGACQGGKAKEGKDPSECGGFDHQSGIESLWVIMKGFIFFQTLAVATAVAMAKPQSDQGLENGQGQGLGNKISE